MQRPYNYMAQEANIPLSGQGYGAISDPSKPAHSIRRRAATLLSILASLLVPWAAFTAVFGLLSFTMHYKHYGLAWFIIAMVAGVTAVCGWVALLSYRKRMAGDLSRDPTWYMFLFATLAFALILGMILGAANFSSNMRQYYDFTNLNMYAGVDPAKVHGEQVMDAGRIMFTKTARLDLNKSMGFRSHEMYCVAPIVSSLTEKLASYDFWAVGTGCCVAGNSDYHCGAYNSHVAHGGLRVLSEAQQKFYKLAVEQAEVAHGLRANHPVFFTWLEDPIAVVNEGQETGLRNFLLGTLSFFAFQLFATLMAAIGFLKFQAG